MGIYADGLFYKSQQRVLAILFAEPERSFYTNEIIAKAAAGNGTIQRELVRLETAGLVNTWKVGNQKHWQANRDAPIFAEIHRIVVKTLCNKPAARSKRKSK